MVYSSFKKIVLVLFHVVDQKTRNIKYELFGIIALLEFIEEHTWRVISYFSQEENIKITFEIIT